MTTPLIKASVLDGFAPFAARKGLEVARLLADCGLRQEDIAEPSAEIPLNAVAGLLHEAAVRSGDPCFGLHWAEAYPVGGSGVLGYLLLNASSVRAAAKAIARYVELHLHPIDIGFHEEDGQGRLAWQFPPEFTAPRTQYASFAMALVVLRLRRHAGPTWHPIGIELEHRALEGRDSVLRVLGPNVRYDSPRNVLHIRETVLERCSDNADRRLFGLIRQLGDRLLAEYRQETDVVAQARRAIVDQLETGDARLKTVAERLGISPAVLQARLADADTNFEALLVETRRGLAESYLRDTELPLTEIALLLGFSELSAFTRAAHRWFGAPPSARRATLRRPDGLRAD